MSSMLQAPSLVVTQRQAHIVALLTFVVTSLHTTATNNKNNYTRTDHFNIE